MFPAEQLPEKLRGQAVGVTLFQKSRNGFQVPIGIVPAFEVKVLGVSLTLEGLSEV
jgi:hypothetical protein